MSSLHPTSFLMIFTLVLSAMSQVLINVYKFLNLICSFYCCPLVQNIFDIGALSPLKNRVKVLFKLHKYCCTKSFREQLKYRVQYSMSASENITIESELSSIELPGLLSSTDYYIIASITTSNGTKIGWPLVRTFHTEDEGMKNMIMIVVASNMIFLSINKSRFS